MKHRWVRRACWPTGQKKSTEDEVLRGMTSIIDDLVDLTKANFRLEAYVQSLLESTKWEWKSNGAIFNAYLGKAIRLRVLRDIVGVVGLSGRVGDQMITNEVNRLFPAATSQTSGSKNSDMEILLREAAAKARLAEGGLANGIREAAGQSAERASGRVGTYVSRTDRG